MQKLTLPTVTLCAAASVNVSATVEALAASLRQVEFAECLLFTDADVAIPNRRVRVVRIDRLRSSRDYSFFILSNLAEHLQTQHCLLVQWDGFVLDTNAWSPEFLSFDYIGAPWPQFDDEFRVGNGGFSFRSRKLLEACGKKGFQRSHPEDVAICRINRAFLEDVYGLRFADGATAERFSFERSPPSAATFGFHGIFNMIPVLGADRFWELYQSLDDRGSIRPDYRLLLRQMRGGSAPLSRQLNLTGDMMKLLGRSGN